MIDNGDGTMTDPNNGNIYDSADGTLLQYGPAAAASSSASGNSLAYSFSGSDAGTPFNDPTANMTPQQAAATYAAGAAQAGVPIPPAVVAQWQAQGVNLAQLVTTAGAAFNVARAANGIFTARPVNAAAQQIAGSSGGLGSLFSSPYMLIALAGLAYVALSN